MAWRWGDEGAATLHVARYSLIWVAGAVFREVLRNTDWRGMRNFLAVVAVGP